MKKKLLIVLLTIISALCTAFAFTACNDGGGGESGGGENVWGIVYTVKAAYAEATELGYAGTLDEFIELISGKDGADGTGITSAKINSDGELVITLTNKTQLNLGKVTGNDGEDGEDGDNGLSAFEIFLKYHPDYDGTEAEWIESLKGTDGENAPVLDEAYIDDDGNLILVMTNGEKINCGKVRDDRPSENFQYAAVKKDGQITGYNIIGLGNVSDMDIVIPAEYNGKPVLDIALTVVEKRLITSVVLSDGITNICDAAFSGCNNLINVTIPDSVTTIGMYAFSGCSILESIEIPDGVTSIGDSAFRLCSSLESITIPNSVTSIGDSAFRDCSRLESITIPNSVTSIGDYAFDSCSSLKSIEIPEGVTSIGDYTFFGCYSLESIEIPDGVTSIGDYAFSGCSSLESIEIPDGVTYIGNSAFNGCSLESIEIPDGVTYIGDYAFSGCNLESIDIPESVTYIGDYAFQNCVGIKSIYIPKGVTSIGVGAFSLGFYLESIIVDKDNQVYHSQGNCLIETESKTLICGCQNSVIPTDGSVTSIEMYAFNHFTEENYTDFTSITIPVSITFIGSLAFFSCSTLTDVYYNGTYEQWQRIEKENSWINYADHTVTLHCSDGNYTLSFDYE